MQLLKGVGLALLLTPLAVSSALAGDGYWLRITTDKLNVRSRPDMNSLRVGQVTLDDALRGVEQLPGWHKILPPADAFCLVSAQHIKQDAAGRGVVEVSEGSNLVVHAGSTVQTVDPKVSEKQALLAPGAEVEILGQEGDWYRIKPPPEVYVYVVADYVERITGEQAAELDRRHASVLELEARGRARRSPSTAPAERAAGDAESLEPIRSMGSEASSATSQPTAILNGRNGRNGVHEMQPLVEPGPSATETTPAALPTLENAADPDRANRLPADVPEEPAGERAVNSASAPSSSRELDPLPSQELQNRLRRAQDMYNTQNQLSPVLRNWEPALQEYHGLAEQRESPLFAGAASKRIREIERRMQDDEFLRKTDELTSRHWTTLNSPGPPPRRERVPVPAAPTSMPYHDARGILRQTGLPDGIGANVAARLVDPYTGRTTAYVDAAESDLGPLEGKYVAIRGGWSKNATGAHDVLRVQQIFVLPLNMRGAPGSR